MSLFDELPTDLLKELSQYLDLDSLHNLIKVVPRYQFLINPKSSVKSSDQLISNLAFYEWRVKNRYDCATKSSILPKGKICDLRTYYLSHIDYDFKHNYEYNRYTKRNYPVLMPWFDQILDHIMLKGKDASLISESVVKGSFQDLALYQVRIYLQFIKNCLIY